MARFITRRNFLAGSALAASGVVLSGCDAFDFLGNRENAMRKFMLKANGLTLRAQRTLLSPDALAAEFTEADIRQPMRPNGVTRPQDQDYKTLAENDFTDFRLEVSGLVERPLSLDLPTIRAMPARTQITRHDCVEGWSCIAKWTGVPLHAILDEARARSDARYVVFHCMDTIERGLSGDVKYYESIDMIDARHPQTILAWGMNDMALPVENGAPLRVRVERQLGYKMAKYVRGIELVADLDGFGRGQGGYWPDRGYEWYAGI
ncbi:molybdopterin-binding protein [Aliihoeflea sp. PC F10.4]